MVVVAVALWSSVTVSSMVMVLSSSEMGAGGGEAGLGAVVVGDADAVAAGFAPVVVDDDAVRIGAGGGVEVDGGASGDAFIVASASVGGGLEVDAAAVAIILAEFGPGRVGLETCGGGVDGVETTSATADE